MVDDKIYKLKKILKELKDIRGRHTELVSVYIPAGHSLHEITNLLSQEVALTGNVKSKPVRKNVIGALTKILQHLKLYKKTPENGLAIFCGNISEKEGVSNIELWTIEPPEAVNIKLYWCDQTFKLEPLEGMVKEKDVYGIFVMDLQEATIGILRGKNVKVLKHMTSIVPGKQKHGGQCVLPDTLIQRVDGSILPIKDITVGSHIHNINFNNPVNLETSKITDIWKSKKNKIFKIITRYPRFEIESSKDHLFFVWENGKIKEKSAKELRRGDFLLIPEKISIKGSEQKLDSSLKYKMRNSKFNKKIKLPEILDEEITQIIGYFMGDGNFDINRICFSDGEKQIVDFYKKVIKRKFNANPTIRYREKKKYYELRVCGKLIVDFIKKNFFDKKDSKKSLIPNIILKSKRKVVGGFLRGFFDAEGYISKSGGKLALGINNKILSKQIQLILLRFGILSSLLEYDNRRNPYSNNPRFTIEISEKKSLLLFEKNIGFSSSRKGKELRNLIKNKTKKSNVRKIAVSGKQIREIIENSGLNLECFPKVSGFFNNKRMMSKNIFRDSILNIIKERKDLYEELRIILDYSIIPVKIHEIDVREEKRNFIDISVENQNFIANGIFVHNSAARFGRVRQGLIHDWFKQIAEMVVKSYSSEIKGILIGGPGPAKEDFLKTELLPNDISKKIIGMSSTGYSSENGLYELLEREKDALKETALMKERELLQKFFSEIEKDSGLVTYGLQSVLKYLQEGTVETVLIAEDAEWEEVELECSCGHAFKKMVRISEKDEQKCPKCKGNMSVIGEMDLIDAIEELAKKYSTTVEIISRETNEGEQLFQLGGIGAVLRYKA